MADAERKSQPLQFPFGELADEFVAQDGQVGWQAARQLCRAAAVGDGIAAAGDDRCAVAAALDIDAAFAHGRCLAPAPRCRSRFLGKRVV